MQKFKQFTIIATFPIEQVDSFAEYYGISEDVDNAIIELTKKNLTQFLSNPFIIKTQQEMSVKYSQRIKEIEAQKREVESELFNNVNIEKEIILSNSNKALRIEVKDIEVENEKEI